MLKSSCRKRCDAEHVPVYRLSDWIDREVHGREIPQETNALLYEKGPSVVMKMDIEMMEVSAFPSHCLSLCLLESPLKNLSCFNLARAVACISRPAKFGCPLP